MKAELLDTARSWMARDDWKLRKDSGHARALSLDVGDGPPVLRFEIDLDAPASACADYAIFRLLETHGEWNASFVSGDVVRDGDDRLYHLRYRGVWPVRPRDFVYRAWIDVDDVGGATEVSGSVEDARFPESGESVRGAILLAYRQVVPLDRGRCRYVSVAQSDIRGSVPEWMVTPGIIKNMFGELEEIARGVAGRGS